MMQRGCIHSYIVITMIRIANCYEYTDTSVSYFLSYYTPRRWNCIITTISASDVYSWRCIHDDSAADDECLLCWHECVLFPITPFASWLLHQIAICIHDDTGDDDQCLLFPIMPIVIIHRHECLCKYTHFISCYRKQRVWWGKGYNRK